MSVEDGGVIEGRAVPLGAYPHYKIARPFVFVSGTSARRPDNSIAGVLVSDDGTIELDIRRQTRAVLTNVGEVLASCGLGLEDLVEVSSFLVNMDDFPGYNEVYGEFFDASGPARTTVAVHQLPHPHLLIEIKAVARLRQ